jgi:hypothetical protein
MLKMFYSLQPFLFYYCEEWGIKAFRFMVNRELVILVAAV